MGFATLAVFLFIRLTSCSFFDIEKNLRGYEQYMTNLDRLNSKLFQNYDSYAAPIYTLSPYSRWSDLIANGSYPDPFPISVEFIYLYLVKVSEVEESIDLLLDYKIDWQDYRLRWDPRDYGGLYSHYYQRDKVWVPDISPMDVHSVGDIRSDHQQLVLVSYDGTMSFYSTIRTSAICNFNLSRFPFDIQVCDVPIETRSLFQPYFNLSITYGTYSLRGNGEWNVTDVNVEKREYLFDDPENSYTEAVISVVIKRHPIYYILMFMLPTFVINTISIFGIFLPQADSMGRLTVGLTNSMSMTFLLGVLSGMIPRTSVFPLLGIFFLSELALITLALVLVTVIGNRRLGKKESKTIWSKLYLYHLFNVMMQLCNIIIFVVFLCS